MKLKKKNSVTVPRSWYIYLAWRLPYSGTWDMTTFNFSQNTKQLKPKKKKDFENLWKYRPGGETVLSSCLRLHMISGQNHNN